MRCGRSLTDLSVDLKLIDGKRPTTGHHYRPAPPCTLSDLSSFESLKCRNKAVIVIQDELRPSVQVSKEEEEVDREVVVVVEVEG